jgi:His/Glu/Gln/Arg/opine family amino acid ABC transporter permease subunit
MSFDFSWLPANLPRLLDGAWLSVKLMLMTAIASFAVGLVAGQMRLSSKWYVRLPATAYVDFFRTTPQLVQIVFFFFLLPFYLGIHTTPFMAGFVALSLNYGAFFSEVFRAGVTSLGQGQTEAAYAIGMTVLQSLRRVIYPQALRRMIPPIGSMFVSMLKDTSLVTILGVPELMNTAQNVGAMTFRNVEVLLVVACMYFSMTYPLAAFANWMHGRVKAWV